MRPARSTLQTRETREYARSRPDGVITSFAGDNNPACGPSGVPKVYAQLEGLVGVAVDAAGAVYIAANGIVRKVSGGVVTTLIDKVFGLTGVAADTAGNVYITGWGITKIAPNGVVSTVLVSNFQTTGAAVDAAGNVYFVDEFGGIGYGAVKKVTPRGVVSTLVGLGLNYPSGVAIDAAGNLYIADYAIIVSGSFPRAVCCRQSLATERSQTWVTAVRR